MNHSIRYTCYERWYFQHKKTIDIWTYISAGDTCYVRGKVQFITFDGLNYNLAAGCNYKLIHDMDHTENMDIILQNSADMSHSSAPKRSVRVRVDGHDVLLGKKRADGTFHVKVDGKLVNLPYEATPRIKHVCFWVIG